MTILSQNLQLRLSKSPSTIQFRTRSLSGVDVKCYHDNKIIKEDYHTQFRRSKDQRGYYIQKVCPINRKLRRNSMKCEV